MALTLTLTLTRCAFMADHIEPGSKIFVISGGGDFWKVPLTLTLTLTLTLPLTRCG